MSVVPLCAFVQAARCSGSPGPSPLWVISKAFTGPFKATGGTFIYGGSCYSLPANPALVANPPAGSTYAVPPVEEIGGGCSDCCTVTPEGIAFACGTTPTSDITIAGPEGSTAYLSWDSCFLVVNGVGPAAGGGSSSVTLGATGATVTVGVASSVCAITCPGEASIGVGTTAGGDECGTVAVFIGCQLPASPVRGLNVTLSQPIVGFPTPANTSGCESTFSNACQGVGSLMMTGTLEYREVNGNPTWGGSVSGTGTYGPDSSGCYSVDFAQSVSVTCNEVPPSCNSAGLVWTITVGSPEGGAWYCSQWDGGTEACSGIGAWGTMVSHAGNTDGNGYPNIVALTVPPYEGDAAPPCLPLNNLTCGEVPSATITITAG